MSQPIRTNSNSQNQRKSWLEETSTGHLIQYSVWIRMSFKINYSGPYCNLWLLYPGLPLYMTLTWAGNVLDIFWLLPVPTCFMPPAYVTDSTLFQMYLLNTLWSFSPLDFNALYCRHKFIQNKKEVQNLFLSSPEALQIFSWTHWSIFNSRSCRSSISLLNVCVLYISLHLALQWAKFLYNSDFSLKKEISFEQ